MTNLFTFVTTNCKFFIGHAVTCRSPMYTAPAKQNCLNRRKMPQFVCPRVNHSDLVSSNLMSSVCVSYRFFFLLPLVNLHCEEKRKWNGNPIAGATENKSIFSDPRKSPTRKEVENGYFEATLKETLNASRTLQSAIIIKDLRPNNAILNLVAV